MKSSIVLVFGLAAITEAKLDTLLYGRYQYLDGSLRKLDQLLIAPRTNLIPRF